MDFSFLKALAASVRGQVSSLKSQSKKLHACANDVFGQAYPLDICQEAVARANGFRGWREVLSLAQRVGIDRSVPAWCIQNRSAFHERCVNALIETDTEVSVSNTVVMLGDVRDASLVGACLWLESISARKQPGLVAIDTKAATFQKTPVGQAVKTLGVADLFQQFRVIDTRSPSIALVLTGTIQQWSSSIFGVISKEDRDMFAARRVTGFFRNLLGLFSFVQYGYPKDYSEDVLSFDAQAFEAAAFAIKEKNFDYVISSSVQTPYQQYMEENCKRKMENFPQDMAERLHDLARKIHAVSASQGILFNAEARHRPAVILLDSDNDVSVVLSSIIRKMYYSFKQPLFYCATEYRDSLPAFLEFGENTILCNGRTEMNDVVWQSHSVRHPLFVNVEPGAIAVSGKTSLFSELVNLPC